ncbi:MAG TPA: ABC transporter permease [Patescibacteria group bacterium]|nr:ABC transporter permease [Patescibacteria group bacterium]
MNLFTEFKEGLGISWSAIRANKMRSILTTLGIVIGIVTVTLMGAAITGLDRAFLRNISTIGADVLYVERFGWFINSHEEWMKMQKRRRITLVQANALRDLVTMAKAVAPVADSEETVRYKKRSSSSVHVIGTTDQYAITSSVGLSQGRFMTPGESAGGRPVCIIGTEVASHLFQRVSPLGNRIIIGDSSFEVIGVLEKQGTFLGMFSLDNQVIVPLDQFTSSFWHNPDYQVQVKVAELAQLEEAREELRAAMRKVRRLEPNVPDDFTINQQDQFIQMFHRLGGTIAAVGLFVTGLSLFVGGIGIMNIMFVSVAERTREIGIRKAIGAKRRTILVQFLIEAAAICLLGGLIGLGIAWPVTLGIQKVFPATLSVAIVALAIGVSLITGVLSGFFPAWRAARMDPVQALRTGD